MQRTGYLAAEGFEEQLAEELGRLGFGASEITRYGRLMAAPGPARPAVWAQNIWHDPQTFEIASIGDGAKKLRAIQRNWALYDFHLHRRARLIEEKLPHVSAKPLAFPATLPTAPLGSWTLLDETHILASPSCSSPFRHGEVEFIEDRVNPPNRAYLKLWEALTLAGKRPQPGETCVDLGACPGGWTWVLATCGAKVVSVDKAPLAPAIATMPGVTFKQESAFGLDPAAIGPVDWLCSDIICYPDRLLSYIKRWLDAGLAKNFICTIKLQGETDHEAIAAFAAIPGSAVRHLYHNKHELTWMLIRDHTA